MSAVQKMAIMEPCPSCQIRCWPYHGSMSRVYKSLRRHSTSEPMNCLWWPVHLKMKKGSTVLAFSFIFLLSLALQGSWCAAEGNPGVSAERHLLRSHLQVQEQFHGKDKDLEIQSPSTKLGLGHEASAVDMKRHRRLATGHKGGSTGGAAGGGGAAGAGGRNVGGGGAVTKPHNSKNGAAALPVPVASVLALAFGCGVAHLAFGL